MIPRAFNSVVVRSNERPVDVLKKLSDTYIGYRTEGMVQTKLYNGSETIEIYVDSLSFGDQDTEEPEEIEENLYRLYECGVEPNHVE
jgi:hypothetical protein